MAGTASASTATIPRRSQAALAAAQDADRPSLIACRTMIGYGAPTKAGTAATHGSPLGADEIAAARARARLALSAVRDPAGAARRLARLRRARRAGARGLAGAPRAPARRTSGPSSSAPRRARCRTGWTASCASTSSASPRSSRPGRPARRARRRSRRSPPAVPELVGGSADLTGSNNTKTTAMQPMTPQTPGGRYIHYGVREHAMAAAMNGMALHGGVIPYGGTFLIFSDYCRPAIRLAALMGQRVIFVLTHDSIGLGEDGPTHQPVEHLRGLRAIPNLLVFRPADAVETAECWALALVRADGPSALALTRQNLPALRTTADEVNRSARGAYVLERGRGPPHGHAARHRLGGRDRACRRASACRRTASAARWSRCRASSCSTGRTRPIARRCWARASGRGRGGIAVRLDALRRQRGRRGRHARLRRLGAGRSAVRAFRHHGRARRRARAQAALSRGADPERANCRRVTS